MDPTREPTALTPEDLALVDQLVTLLRSARAASVVVQLRQRLDERELQDLAALLVRGGAREGWRDRGPWWRLGLEEGPVQRRSSQRRGRVSDRLRTSAPSQAGKWVKLLAVAWGVPLLLVGAWWKLDKDQKRADRQRALERFVEDSRAQREREELDERLHRNAMENAAETRRRMGLLPPPVESDAAMRARIGARSDAEAAAETEQGG